MTLNTLMKRLGLSIMLLFCILGVRAQYGNEWIDFDKTYFKIKITEDGLYRLPAAVLAQAGLSSANGASYRLYLLGNEVPVYVTTSGVLGADDFIEFIGKKNRGELDKVLYSDPDKEQLNPYMSMFTDTSVYFLTTEDDGEGLRIVEVENDLTNAPDPELYYIQDDRYLFNDEVFDPRLQAGQITSYSHYAEGEGLASTISQVHTLDILANNIVTTGPDAVLEARFVTDNLVNHDVIATLGSDTILRQQHFGVKLLKINAEVPAESILSSNSLKIDDGLSASGQLRLASVSWRYPREFVFSDISFLQFNHASGAGKQLFSFEGLNQGQEKPLVFDLSGNIRITGEYEGDHLRVVLPLTDSDRGILVVSSEQSIRYIQNITEVHFTDLRADNTEYVIVTHPFFRTGDDAVGAYLDYRKSEDGGAFAARAYNVLEIQDQFGFGIPGHSQALRNFAFFMRNNWPDLSLIYIIGKGLDYDIAYGCDDACSPFSFVATFGSPGSDNLLFASKGERLPVAPVGRLPVVNQEEILTYLDKIKEYDRVALSNNQTAEAKMWTKNVLHLGGGREASQQVQIKGLLDNMGQRMTESKFGAELSTFTKQSTTSAGNPDLEEIFDLLKGGVSIAKFFGHSGSKQLDYNINNPAAWDNKGRYPIFSAMGCSAGHIHQAERSLAESFVFEPDAGSIAFIAASGTQYLDPLASWGNRWYYEIGEDLENINLGTAILRSLEPVSQSINYTTRVLVEQQTIIGDPALKFYPSEGLDYTWDPASVRFDPAVLTTTLENFTLNIDFLNIGLNIADTVGILIEQESASGKLTVLFQDRVYVDHSRKHLTLSLPMLPDASGLNTLFLTLDPDSLISELPSPHAEANNQFLNTQGRIGLDMFVLDNRVLASSPKEFAIVTETKPELIAAMSNAFAFGRTVVIEIDTTAHFNSPVAERMRIEPDGGVLHWQPSTAFTPNTVYYWRTSLDSLSPENGFTWDNSSFLYDPQSDEGWNQSHYFQFLRDELAQVQIDSQDRQFEFGGRKKNIWVQNAVQPTEDETLRFYIDGSRFNNFVTFWQNVEAHVFVAVFDSFTTRTIKNPPGGQYGAVNPFSIQRPVFPFKTNTPEDRLALMNFLQDTIPSGQFVALYTYQRLDFMDYYPEEWENDSLLYGKNIFSVIEDIYPDSNIRLLKQKGAVPYTIMYRKDREVFTEQIAAEINATTNAEFDFEERFIEGTVRSTRIGPASSWNRIEWNRQALDSITTDTIAMRYIAYSQDGLDSIVTEFSIDSLNLLSSLDADLYPYLFLEVNLKDEEERTAPQYDWWRAFYTGSPDYLINSSEAFLFETDTLKEGETLKFATAIQNIGRGGMDSVEVELSIINASNESSSTIIKIPPLNTGEIYPINFETIAAGSNSGRQTFLVQINPFKIITESNYANNTALLEFYLARDELNPVMDVTFDGRHLKNDDFVASDPIIEVLVIDNSDIKPLNEVEDFELFLKRPAGADFEMIDVRSPEVEFFPSNIEDLANENIAKLIFHPMLDEEGFYIFKVKARDASGTYSGELSYQVQFQIDDRRGITYAKVFPNPMRTTTQFDFILYGATSGSELRIDIYDLTGKLIHEIQADPYVGSHNIHWDGSNMAGNHLAPGTYYYRIIAKDADGKNLPVTYPNGSFGVKAGEHVGKIAIVE